MKTLFTKGNLKSSAASGEDFASEGFKNSSGREFSNIILFATNFIAEGLGVLSA
jgi:hypothetical protein